MENEISDAQVEFFQLRLLAWFKKNRRVFPWRKANLSDYQLIISEVLLQRTKAETIAGFYERFILEYPGWESVSTANIEELALALKPIGLHNQRAKRLSALAKYVIKMGGRIPMERESLEKFPFMGQYIANAVELLIYKQNKPLLDVNMARVLERYFGPRKLSDIRFDPYLQELSHRVVDHSKTKQLNWAVLDFAALVCKARKPECLNCILNKRCLFFRNNTLYFLILNMS